MREFAQAYKQLNAAQRKAVDTIDGPVQVIAGPGTGKTQLLSMRVANILRRTDTSPSNILCLTFTNKAATNMRDRLLTLIGPTSHAVMVKTFHSFAAEIMNSYPDYFWNGARLSTAPDAVQLEIIQDILTNLPLNNPLALKFAGTYTMTNDVQSALKLAKEAGLTSEKLRAILHANIAYINVIEQQLIKLFKKPLIFQKLDDFQVAVDALPDQATDELTMPLISLGTVVKESLRQAIAKDQISTKTIHTSRWKRRWIQSVEGKKGMFDERNRNSWWLALADVYERYRDILHTRGYYDYADMVVEVINQLEQHAELRASVQERFLYVLIDEFQDTNAAQLRLAHLVANHYASEGQPNLMVVGDDDQTIFAFNGAELSNMLSFKRNYPKAKVVVLQANYRSTQPILDTAKTIIEQAEQRLTDKLPHITKNLRAVTKPIKTGTIKHIAYPTREHQLYAVAEKLKELWQQADLTIAVLARGHDSLRQIASVLLAIGVPVQYEQQRDVLTHEAVVQATLIAEVVVAITEGNETLTNQKLSQLIRHPLWHINGEELWHLAISNYAEPHWLESLLKNKHLDIQKIGHWLIWLAGQTGHQPLVLMLEYILGLRDGEHLRSPLRDYFMSSRDINNTYLETLSAISLLRELANEYALDGKATLSDFVRYITLNRANHKIIADESWFASSGQAVQLLTVHKAKGLEFDTVVIVDAIEDNWKPRRTGRKPPANLPLQPYGDTYDDYVRLMYVAATRARHSLIFTSYYHDYAGKELLATPLIRNGIATTTIDSNDTTNAVPILESAVRWPRLESNNEQALLSKNLKTFSLSATGLLNFLDVSKGGPRHFMEHDLLRLPEAKTAALAFGNAMHTALETAQKLVNTTHFGLGEVINSFENALKSQYLPIEEHERYIVHGQNVLQSLFKNPRFVLQPGSIPEQRLADIRLERAVINGKLDRLDIINENHLVIIDYKTGKPLIDLQTKNQQLAVKAWRHRSQLIFYRLLVGKSSLFKKFSEIEGQMLYVEARGVADLVRSYHSTTGDLKRITLLIEAVWRHIMDLDFPITERYSADLKGITAFEDDLINGAI